MDKLCGSTTHIDPRNCNFDMIALLSCALSGPFQCTLFDKELRIKKRNCQIAKSQETPLLVSITITLKLSV